MPWLNIIAHLNACLIIYRFVFRVEVGFPKTLLRLRRGAAEEV